MTVQQLVRATHPPGLDQGATVLLTGDLGEVGGWLAVALLERGYRVRGTLRSLTAETALRASLSRLVTVGDQLSLVAADLQREVGWEPAATGCDVLVHVAPCRGARAVEQVVRAAERAGIERVSLMSLAFAAEPARPASGASSSRPAAEGDRWTDLGLPLAEHERRARSLFRWMAPSFPRIAAAADSGVSWRSAA